MRNTIITSFVTIITFLSMHFFGNDAVAQTKEYKINKFLIVEVNEAITPVTLNHLKKAQESIKNEPGSALLIKMNTPGGLVSITKDIMHLIANSENLVIGWIGPSSASATSAGAIISSSIPTLYMADGTRIGAATPISGSSDIKEGDMKNKIINDLVALVKSQADGTGKNPKIYTKMITEATSLTAQEALEENAHNGIVDKIQGEDGLIELINGKEYQKHHEKYKISVESNHVVVTFEKTIGQKVMAFFASPDMAYILFLIGAALIYLEFQAPGGFIAGSVGAVLILVAGISFGVLSLNVGALLLVIASFVLFILEIYITSFGILTIAGIASLIIGSLYLFQTEESYLQISATVLFSSIGAILSFIGLIAYIFYKSRKRIFSEPDDPYSGRTVAISAIDGDKYYTQFNGELWQLTANGDMSQLKVGDKVTIIKKDNVKLLINI
ncbi:nodulation efficiency protein NfeD [Halobacteriovorax sp. BALOs_7]|uniref:NfeD family protein n=1 Tax=Halobacteriovorax sp. BALOs_7 TaxID=2109558 RepID=UPI000EB76B8D|nr:hypothetical protein [Halobacteriovorax sp. BALOs_7]AYF44453.1 nodulation efficiency protein NfeD [Halobacteriovorax sp. BALOs_7]